MNEVFDAITQVLTPKSDEVKNALVDLFGHYDWTGVIPRPDLQGFYEAGDDRAALGTEALSYNLMGKATARTFLGRADALCNALGFDLDDIVKEAYRRREQRR